MGGSGRPPEGAALVGVLCPVVALDGETVAGIFDSVARKPWVLVGFNVLVAGLAARTGNTAAFAAALSGVVASLSTPGLSGDGSGSGAALAIIVAA